MERKRTFNASEEANNYLDKIKRSELSYFMNNLLEFLNNNDLSIDNLKEKIRFANKYEPLIDNFEQLIFSGELFKGTQTVQAMPIQNIAKSEPVNNDNTKDLKAKAREFNMTVEEYIKTEEKASSMGYDVKTYLDMEDPAAFDF